MVVSHSDEEGGHNNPGAALGDVPAQVVVPPPSDGSPNMSNGVSGRARRKITTSLAAPATPSTPSSDQLERCGRWLSSIPRDDVTVLRQTPEYEEFLCAFERLGHAHRRVISQNRSEAATNSSALPDPDGQHHSALSNSLHASVLESGNGASSNVIHSHHDMNNNMSSSDQSPESANCLAEGAHTHELQQEHRYGQRHLPRRLSPVLSNNFLQHTDDVVLRILEFLECQSLIRTSLTCSRFKQLSYKSAVQRTYDVAHARQLNNVMQLLRAREQIFGGVGGGGAADGARDNSHVRVPMLLLGRRVLVTEAGDPDYNGVYHCTNSNGNGFVFTKPRHPVRRVSPRRRRRRPRRLRDDDDNNNNNNSDHEDAAMAGEGGGQEHRAAAARQRLQNLDLDDRQQQQWRPRVDPVGERGVGVGGVHLEGVHQHHQNPLQLGGAGPEGGGNNATIPTAYLDWEPSQPGQPLRCIIAKRFSNETILWYMSKEVETAEELDGVAQATTSTTWGGGDAVVVQQEFSFWANLMMTGDATEDLSRYPSQSSILARRDEGWHSLSPARTPRPPTLELLD